MSSTEHDAADALHPAVVHHLVNSLGWHGLRPLQAAAVAPLMAGRHALLIAPTAAGKTEAALLPVFSRMLGEGWRGLSVLYLCPLKALLNNLEPRLSALATLFGRRVGVWHGDVGAADKRRWLREPPDLLLITPESIEALLIGTQVHPRHWFADLRAVIVDELHAFAADDRGWHVLALLERVERLAGRSLQRIGLSATVGNPAVLLDWFAGHCDGERTLVQPPAGEAAAVELRIDYVGSLANAACVIAALHAGEKRLVFCDSRLRAEELTTELRRLGVQTWLSHGSLSAELRRQAEGAFTAGRNCVIVATSTLELGLDVGDLDRVIQIDAPATVSGFLQRLGRSGRRPGSTRNCLFLATHDDGLLRVLALLRLWRKGYVEPLEAPPAPWHLFVQQLLTLVLQERGLPLADWQSWLGRIPVFLPRRDTAARIVRHLLATGVLWSDEGVLRFDQAGERLYGGRHLPELLSAFASDALITVFCGRDEIGRVHPLSFVDTGNRPLLLLGGRTWKLQHIDWPAGIAHAVPAQGQGSARWLGNALLLSAALSGEIRQLLYEQALDSALSRRAQTRLHDLYAMAPALPEKGSLMVCAQGGKILWWTFAGSLVNAVVAGRIKRQYGWPVHADAYSVIINASGSAWEQALELRRQLHEWLIPPDDADIRLLKLPVIKFSEHLPEAERNRMQLERLQVTAGLYDLAQKPIVLERED